jgi:hypothetical protein
MSLLAIESVVDVVCPHCHRQNSFLVVRYPIASSSGLWGLDCVHCRKSWQEKLLGPVVDGPFQN